MQLINGILETRDGEVFRKTGGCCYSLLGGIDPNAIRQSLFSNAKYALVLNNDGLTWLFHGSVFENDGLIEVQEHRVTIPAIAEEEDIAMRITQKGFISVESLWRTVIASDYQCLVKENAITLSGAFDGTLSMTWPKGQQKIDLNDPDVKDLLLYHGADCDKERLLIKAARTVVQEGRIYVGLIYHRVAEPHPSVFAAVLLEYSWGGYGEGGESLALRVKNPTKDLCGDLLSICDISSVSADAIVLRNPTTTPSFFTITF